MIHLSGEINRLAGYRSALLDMGLELDDALVPVHANDRDYDRGAVARAWSFRTDRHLLGQFTRLNVPPRATRDRTAAAVGFGVFPLATSSGRYRDRSEAAQLGEFDAARTERLEHPNMAPYCMNIVESLTDQTRLLVSTTTSVSALIFAGWLSCTRSRSRRTQNHVRNADA